MRILAYKEMYLKLFRASEQAINLPILAQRECKEWYLSHPESDQKGISMTGNREEITDNE